MTESALPLLIQQMLHPEFYTRDPQPPSVTSSQSGSSANRLDVPSSPIAIQLVQTHISYVLLTGEYAYKVKKPLNFGFLNYTTLAQRRHFCEEEVRLNQRGAAELYLEVIPITQTDTSAAEVRFQLGGAGKVVEYAVKMRQFPQETLLTELFERGELTETLMQELAAMVAQFHRKATTNEYIRSFGEVAQVRQAFDENYEQTKQYIGSAQTQQQFDQTRAYTDRFFAEQPTLFDRRIQTGWIRECHGDLHLRNICYWNNRFLLFDCIEFNEPFRFVDVMFDIAYIVMDLEARHRSDLSTIFLNTYVEQTGDWEGLQVLPIYVSRQTYVRAKVTSFLLNDPAVSDKEKQAAQETAANYYKMAWRFSNSRSGQLILMAGLSGSGKSTTARYLAPHLNAIHIRSDAVRKHLAGIALDQSGGEDLYTPAMTQKIYDRLLELGVLLAQQGYAVILDAKYDRQALRSTAIAQAQAHHLPVRLLHCTAPMDVLHDRVAQRSGDIADATVDVLARQQMEPFTESEQSYVHSIDTTRDLRDQLKPLGMEE